MTKCVPSCMAYEGGEVRHHKMCPSYPDSFSKMYDDLKEIISQPAKPNLGCATTMELIDEIRFRLEETVLVI